jgi:hypothetical protein
MNVKGDFTRVMDGLCSISPSKDRGFEAKTSGSIGWLERTIVQAFLLNGCGSEPTLGQLSD